MTDYIRKQLSESIAAKQAVLEDSVLLAQVESLAGDMLHALRVGGKIIFAGNGGSFADAQHLSTEFTSRFQIDRAPLASLTLGTNNSAISAIGNDYGYEQVFARELVAIVSKNDVFIAISTSGNSANILQAVKVANELGTKVIGWTGASGGKLASSCDCLKIPSDITARIQECHITIGHILCGMVEAAYFQDMT